MYKYDRILITENEKEEEKNSWDIAGNYAKGPFPHYYIWTSAFDSYCRSCYCSSNKDSGENNNNILNNLNDILISNNNNINNKLLKQIEECQKCIDFIENL